MTLDELTTELDTLTLAKTIDGWGGMIDTHTRTADFAVIPHGSSDRIPFALDNTGTLTSAGTEYATITEALAATTPDHDATDLNDEANDDENGNETP